MGAFETVGVQDGKAEREGVTVGNALEEGLDEGGTDSVGKRVGPSDGFHEKEGPVDGKGDGSNGVLIGATEGALVQVATVLRQSVWSVSLPSSALPFLARDTPSTMAARQKKAKPPQSTTLRVRGARRSHKGKRLRRPLYPCGEMPTTDRLSS